MYFTEIMKVKAEGRLDYWAEEVKQKGGILTRSRFMYPADNALLIESIRRVGEEVVR